MFEPGLIYRILIYIAFGIVCEVIFTAVYDLIKPGFLKSWNVFSHTSQADLPHWRQHRDVRAMGYTFLWMIPIYALLFTLEPVLPYILEWPFYLRGIFYACGVWIIEYIGGFLIKLISGKIPWDYSHSDTHVHGLIRWDFFPYWFCFGLGAEKLILKSIALSPHF